MPGRLILLLVAIVQFAWIIPAAAQDRRELSRFVDTSVGKVIVFTGSGAGTGSGYAVASDPDNDDVYFLTNNHVIDGGQRIIVGYGEDGQVREFSARVLLADAEYDMALLRLTPRSSHDFQPEIMPLADFAIERGDQVFAMGFPGFADRQLESYADPAFFEPVMTNGIVGKRYENAWVPLGRKVEVLQHSADINRGNSGGPLFDECGNVVGLNTAFAIDADDSRAASLASSNKAIEEFLGRSEITPLLSGGRCDGTIGVGGWNADDILALVAGALILTSIAGGGVYVMRRNGGGEATAPAARKAASAAAAGAPFLFVEVDGKRHPVTLETLKNGVTIGRGGDADVTVPNDKLSRSHLKLILFDRKLQVQDLGSTNGTTIDGMQIAPRQPVQVNTDTRIELGGVRLVLERGARDA